MSDVSGGPGWWEATDGKWYAPLARAPGDLQPVATERPLATSTANPPSRRRSHGSSMGLIAVVVVLIVLAVGGVIVGVSSSRSSTTHGVTGPRFADISAIATALQSAGLGCGDFKDVTHDTAGELGPDYASARGSCTVDDESVKFATYKDAGAQRNENGLAQGLGCSIAKGFGITSFASVEGPQWDVTPQTETEARAIAAKIGGDVHLISCS